MCQSQAEGGRRCGAHLRGRWESASFGTAEWDDAAAKYATTREGRIALERVRHAASLDDIELRVALNTALQRGVDILSALAAANSQLRPDVKGAAAVTEIERTYVVYGEGQAARRFDRLSAVDEWSISRDQYSVWAAQTIRILAAQSDPLPRALQLDYIRSEAELLRRLAADLPDSARARVEAEISRIEPTDEAVRLHEEDTDRYIAEEAEKGRFPGEHFGVAGTDGRIARGL